MPASYTLSLFTVHYFLHDICTFSICMYKSESTNYLTTVPTLSSQTLYTFSLFLFHQWQTLTPISSLQISFNSTITLPQTLHPTTTITILIIFTISSTTPLSTTLTTTLFSTTITIIIFTPQLLHLLLLL